MNYKKFYKLSPTDKKQTYGLGDGLYGGIEPIKKGGGKYFVYRSKKYGEHRIGTTKKWSFTEAKEEAKKLQNWVNENRCNVSLYKKRKYERLEHTLKDAADIYLHKIKESIKPNTLKGYERQLFNQALPFIGADTPLVSLEWDNGGREKILELHAFLSEGRTGENARKILNVLRSVFEEAIDNNWMKGGSNPAKHPKNFKQKKSHQPSISWSEVPTLMKKLNTNTCNGADEVVLAVKMLLMTFLRTSALVQLQWNWIKKVDGIECFEIPPDIAGLKNTKISIDSGTARYHHVPITDEIQQVLDQRKTFSRWSDYVFWSPRGKKYPHLSPDSLNHHLIRLGYKGLLNAHGWRDLPLTAGQEVLKTNSDIIQLQMGHKLGDAVRQAYDKSKMLEERKEFLDQWCNALVDIGLKI